jgi:hypothetical protein
MALLARLFMILAACLGWRWRKYLSGGGILSLLVFAVNRILYLVAHVR